MGEQVTYSISEAISETTGSELNFFEKSSFDRLIRLPDLDVVSKARIFSEMARFNTLYMISRAGSGHIGSSFSSLDIVSWLFLNELKEGDRFFSSKGHDSPGLYAVQTALGIIPFEKLHALRRLEGLPGHPDVGTPGAFTNTGSLGMGISKAKGFLFADDLLRHRGGRVIVLTGDGELQEGQFWESLVTAAQRNDSRLIVIVDHNKVQSDTHVSTVSDLGDLEAKFGAFGWDCLRIDGHDYVSIRDIFKRESSRPIIVIADTIKGKGVSFMEHTVIKENEYYKYHSGAPSRSDYLKAVAELSRSILSLCKRSGTEPPQNAKAEIDPIVVPSDSERMIPVYSEAILTQAERHPNLVALDADLVLDTGLIPFKNKYPQRFVECGIAEQDMVSQAGTMALAGLIPVVHSFACFLTGRASEQIYNNCTQRRKVIYVGSLAGILPAGPGHSHQAIRDISTMASMPEMAVIEPLVAGQVREVFEWAVNDTEQSCYIRLTSIPYSTRPELSTLKSIELGKGHTVRTGDAAIVVVNGPILLNEVLVAADLLQRKDGISVKVIGMPWLNTIDASWFKDELGVSIPLIVVENHNRDYGFGCWFLSKVAEKGILGSRKILALGVDGIPLGGRNQEVLQQYNLDGPGIQRQIAELLNL